MMTSLGQWEQAKHRLQVLQCSGGSAACGDKWRERNVHRQQQWAGFSVMNLSQIGGALMQSNKHRLTAQKTRTGKKYLRQFFTDSHAQGSSHFCYCYSFPFPFVVPTELIQFEILITWSVTCHEGLLLRGWSKSTSRVFSDLWLYMVRLKYLAYST